jgi:hypothetical protein
MTKPLLERQVNLIEHMTSGVAIFSREGDLSRASDVEGIDRTLLRIEAQFSYAKRMEKITAVLPRTFALLGRGETAIVREFVEICPPTTINRLENARQFQRFLLSRWGQEMPDPPYIRDVAACELACAEVDADVQVRDSQFGKASCSPPRGIRRCRAAVLLRCAYDIRPIFETGLQQAVPKRRETLLVIALPPGANRPQVLEVVPAIFALLAALDDWADPVALHEDPDCAGLLMDLTARGLVEVCE